MNTSASTQQNSPKDLNIILELGGNLFDKNSISKFVYENEINKRPSGSFILKDLGGLLSTGLESGSYGILIFTNTTDSNAEKLMILPIYLESVETVDKNAMFYYYRIQFLAGNLEQMKVKTGDVILNANSVDALRKICEERKSVTIPFSGESSPTDSMNWILVHQDMWSQLNSVVTKSFLSNDCVFWAWDDVNNAFSISSILTEKNKKNTHVFMKSPDNHNPTDLAKEIIESPESVIWRYGACKKTNQLGSVYQKIFPNVSFLGLPTDTIRSVGIRKKNFISLLKATKDTKIDEILAVTGLNPEDAVYGELQIRKQNLNGHDLYSFADIYRDYKLATYSKVFVCQIVNTIGPPIGSFVTSLNWESSNEGTMDLDLRFSDKYMILKKKVEYLGKTKVRSGREIDAKTSFVTTLVMVSDNFGDGTEQIQSVISTLGRK